MNFFESILASKLAGILLPELIAALKSSWTPALEAELKTVFVKWLKSVADNTANPVDNVVVSLVAQMLGVQASDMQ